ncbi:hypothetical protein SAMN05216257_105177 [Meinhardsimonia xiamenensis]|jgi:hypothetical protein|uniref:Uncharacterized protein n=1 Tax=Meinhardsimonia xiamenensis TaxID=990712 RepID=A0A1G9FG70_9RHOB|nr:hypothetical protein [Meinhardsimonia xiamenensis]PRX37858.1 hypothetical protein LV81_00126 [Meinhardsimonia xiamenensis]SDK87441.1 hypothetical protein SAMN05216257_105177 [Meinhardsimonia xiamenensis]
MHRATKIATCSYCGTRAALVLSGEGVRHELSCAACGAPLHELKAMPRPAAPPEDAPRRDKSCGAPRRARASTGDGASAPKRANPGYRPQPARRRKPRKGAFRRIWEKVADGVEDLFDDIFD